MPTARGSLRWTVPDQVVNFSNWSATLCFTDEYMTDEGGRQMSEVSALLADLVRWTVFLIGLWATASFVFALVVGVHYLDRGAGRAWNTIQAGLTFYMALGALLVHPAGWYAAVAVTIINPIEAVVRYRWITTGFRSAARGAVLFQLCLILLLALLLTPSGRAAFNVAVG